MAQNIIHLAYPPTDQIELLEKVLARARAGELGGVVIVTLDAQGNRARGFAAVPVEDTDKLVSAMMQLGKCLLNDPVATRNTN